MTSPRVRAALAMACLSSAAIGCHADEATKTSSTPAAVTSKPVEPFQIRAAQDQDRSARSVFDELRIQVLAYDLIAPLNHRASFWIEVWRDGKLDPTLSEGRFIQPHRERPLFGRVVVSFMEGDSMNSPRSRWSTRLEHYNEERTADHVPNGQGSSGQVRWVDDPFKADGITHRSAQTFAIPKPAERGRTYTLHVMTGTRGQGPTLSEGAEPSELARTVPVALFLRARIERVPTGRLRDFGELGSTIVPPALLEE